MPPSGTCPRSSTRCTPAGGRPSIPPERLLKAKVLQALYTIRSEVLLVEALDYNLLFRWFLDLNLLEPVWDNSTFTKNQARLGFGLHALMANRNGLCVQALVSTAHGVTERAAAARDRSTSGRGPRRASGPTRATTPPRSWAAAAGTASSRTWPGFKAAKSLASMAGPPGASAIRPASAGPRGWV